MKIAAYCRVSTEKETQDVSHLAINTVDLLLRLLFYSFLCYNFYSLAYSLTYNLTYSLTNKHVRRKSCQIEEGILEEKD